MKNQNYAELMKKTKKELVDQIELLYRHNFELHSAIEEKERHFESLKHLGAILDDSVFEIFMLDRKTLGFIYANRKARENLGYTAGELAGLTVHDLKKHFGDGELPRMAEPLIGEQTDKIEYTAYHARKDGTLYPVEVHLQNSTFNKAPVLVALILDITKRTRTEERLKETLSQLSKINRYETVIGIVTRTVHNSVNLKTVLENSVQAIYQNMDVAKYVAIFLVEGTEAVLHAQRGLPEWFAGRVARIQYPAGTTWRTIIQGKTEYVPDTEAGEHLGRAGLELGIRSYVSIPLKNDGKVVGVINIFTDVKNSFRADELRLLDIVSRQIEIAINNARFTESLIASEKALEEKINTLSKKESYERIIYTVAGMVHSSVDFDEVLRLTIDSLRQNIKNADFIAVFFVEGNEAVMKAEYGYGENFIRKIEKIPYPRGLTWRTIIEGRTRFVPDTSEDDAIGPAGRQWGLKSYISMPIKTVGNTIGCVTLGSKSVNAFDRDELSLLESVAEQIAVALLNAKYVTEIESNERRLKALVGSVDEIVFEMDENGTYLGIWTENEELLIRPKSELLGRRISDFFDEDFTSMFLEAIRRVLGNRKSEVVEYKLFINGGERSFRARVNPIFASGTEPGTVSMLARDVTESKALETQLLRSQRLESVGKLAGGIAHDLNNILQPILMSIQLLNTRITDEKSRSWLEILDRSAQRGADLIRQILSFARGLESKKQPFDLKYLVKDVQKIVDETFPKFITLHTEIEDSVPSVYGDYTQLNQVLMNLLVNARDAMPEGGDLGIAVKSITAGEERTPVFLKTDYRQYIVIEISDNGVGIPSEYMDRIFDPFFTTKEQDKGTGLGLSTVYGIVKDHDGYINVESQVGKGTTFTIYLPVIHSEDAALTVDELYPNTPSGNGEVILVVDDESMITDMARTILEEYDYKVLVAHNGEEATRVFDTHKDEIYAAIVDMMMPVMGGKATIRILKRERPSLKVIATSGYQREHELVDLKDAEVDAFLPKPFNAETLLQTLNDVMN
ncbi:MAG: GAF domain-containing protein [Thermodesulfobacteriota bacterium]